MKPLEIAKKIDALELWHQLTPYNFAVKPKGTVFPYFCSIVPEDSKPVKVRLLMLEGWQTLHDFIRARVDRNFGFYSSPIEFPHFELVILASGEMHVFRHDAGYMPIPIGERQEELVARILWEVYGVMLRLESEPKLPLSFVSEQAIFGRVEVKDGVWEDRPLAIPDPMPHVEKVSFPKDDLKRAKDTPLVTDDVLHVDFRLRPEIMTKETRPRAVYQLIGFDPKTKSEVFDLRASINPEQGLRGLWEAMPRQFLKALIERGRLPGQVKVCSGRVFRMLRPLCIDIPFKLSLHDKLEFA